jgi:hypothetical protein
MERRCAELEQAIQGGPETQAFLAISRLLGFYANGQTSPEQTKLKATVYLDVLTDQPGWAVAEAVRRWFAGNRASYPNVASFEFAPSPALVRQAASEITKVASGQLVLLRRALAAKPIVETPPAEREAIGARLEEVLQSMSAGAKRQVRQVVTENEASARARRARVHAETAGRRKGEAA